MQAATIAPWRTYQQQASSSKYMTDKKPKGKASHAGALPDLLAQRNSASQPQRKERGGALLANPRASARPRLPLRVELLLASVARG